MKTKGAPVASPRACTRRSNSKRTREITILDGYPIPSHRQRWMEASNGSEIEYNEQRHRAKS